MNCFIPNASCSTCELKTVQITKSCFWQGRHDSFSSIFRTFKNIDYEDYSGLHSIKILKTSIQAKIACFEWKWAKIRYDWVNPNELNLADEIDRFNKIQYPISSLLQGISLLDDCSVRCDDHPQLFGHSLHWSVRMLFGQNV